MKTCTVCNTGLGKFKDNAELLKKAIDYLSDTDQNKKISILGR